MSQDDIFKKVGVSNIKEFIEKELRIINDAFEKGLETRGFQELTVEEIKFIIPYVNEAFKKGIVKDGPLKKDDIF